ncbi:hypothetical protein BCR42DRAFT_399228 [Absidia repens]|uniref:Uncharacterized protein n=1 Tax=Absidia repens TaxID=90262 RepID=A0A1X2IZP4_9FUNG|nr:hypothetical protein BCR42DRAFT_399228 [Absidia repens]
MSTAEPVTSLSSDQSAAPNDSRVIYDRTTLLALASSQLARTPPNQMAHVPGITKGNNQEKSAGAPLAGASPYRKVLERKKEEQEKKKTYNPFALLNEDE